MCNSFNRVIGSDYTDENGYYDIPDLAAFQEHTHSGHCEVVTAGKPGYIAVGKQMLNWDADDTQLDFELPKE